MPERGRSKRAPASTLSAARLVLTWPIRVYISRAPWRRWKNFAQRRLLPRLLPAAPASFVHTVPGGASVRLLYRELLGVEVVVRGEFEAEEVRTLCARARPGSTAIDVGANVGYFTVALAHAVTASGRVIAVEPYRPTLRRLRENIELNGLDNVEVVECAAGRVDGRVELVIAADPAICTTVAKPGPPTTTVPCIRLDGLWERAGRPDVSVVKVDAEGAEGAVLEGAWALLTACRPTLVLEANSSASRAELEDLLRPLRYRRRQPSGFRRWSQLFEADGETDPEPAGHVRPTRTPRPREAVATVNVAQE